MSEQSHNLSDLPPSDLERAIEALRESPILEGPSPMLRERTLVELARAEQREVRWRVVRLAAVIAFVALGAAAVAIWLNRQNRPPEARHQLPSQVIPPIAPPVRPIEPVHQTTEPAPPVLAADVSIYGHVHFHGETSNPKPIDMRTCPQCVLANATPVLDESLVVNSDGTLQNVVVSISGGLPSDAKFASPVDPIVLDQKGCMFHPHVVVAMIGQPIVVQNSDPFAHTVRSTDAEQSPAFNFAQLSIGRRMVEPLQEVETFRVKCDIHPWMNAWVRVFNHPYFCVTASDGVFTIRNLPPGEYRIKAWHEKLGVEEKTITVTGGRPAKIDFTFEGP